MGIGTTNMVVPAVGLERVHPKWWPVLTYSHMCCKISATAFRAVLLVAGGSGRIEEQGSGELGFIFFRKN